MKTTKLIELQKAITQGPIEYYPHIPLKGETEWIVGVSNQPGTNLFSAMAVCYTKHNALAISLVPSLLREVVELRKALCDVDYYLTGSGQGWINASNEGREAWKQVRAIVSKF